MESTAQSTPPSAPAVRKVSKEQVLKFVERQFLLADKDEDGSLTIEELQTFLQGLTHPRVASDGCT